MTRPALALAGYVAVAALLGPRRAGRAPVLCPFRRLTGRHCPACGLTRSIAATVRGDLRAGVAHHRLGPMLVVAVAVWCATGVARPLSSSAAHDQQSVAALADHDLGQHATDDHVDRLGSA